MLFATGRSIEGPTEETIDFLRAAGVDIASDSDGGAEGGEEEGEERRGGGGRENDQNGLKGCYHTIDSSARTGESNPHGRSRINFKLRRG